jgi:lysozyme
MLNGLDVAALDGCIDWLKVRNAGNSFAYVRAAYGTRADANLMRNVDGAREAGLATGVYHFLRATCDYRQQIDLMLELIDTAGVGAGDLPPSLDLEDNPEYDGPWNVANNDRYLTAVSKWIDAVRARTGACPVLYTRAGFWQTLGNPTAFCDCPLWVASYRPAPPKLPAGWKRYTIWQYGELGTVDGVEGEADMNRFNGGPADLQAFLLK